MRVFIGVDVPGDWHAALTLARKAVTDADPGWAGEKWVPSENLHLTLKFLGDIPDDAAAFLGEDLGRALAGTKTFSLPMLHAVRGVPTRRKATMLWTTLRDPEDACAALVSRIEDVAADYGVVPGSKRLDPHVTLVRARSARPFGAEHEAAEAVTSALGPSPSMSVAAVTVYSSRLTTSRPYYNRLAVVSLGD